MDERSRDVESFSSQLTDREGGGGGGGGGGKGGGCDTVLQL